MDEKKRVPEGFFINSDLFYDAIVRSTDDYIYIVDMEKDISLVSENMARDFELPGRLVSKLMSLWGELIHEKDQMRYYDSLEKILRGETDEHYVEYQVRNRKNEYVWIVCRGRLQRKEDGTPEMFAGVISNLERRGKVDYTTGLYTQSECAHLVDRLLESGERGGIMLLGLDDFTRINNLQNHSFGDFVLRQFAQNIQRLLPYEASIFRFDGDEFAIVYRQASQQQMWDLYCIIREYSSHEHEIDGVPYYCTFSGGIVMIGRDGMNYPELIKYAASALEASKRKGKNTCTVFTVDLIQSKLRTLELANQLQISVVAGMKGFHLVYQPFTRSKGMSLAGAEALLRWSCEKLGEVSPIEFIPSLESSGLIVPVGRWVLAQAVQTCKKWSAFEPDFVMNINISYRQFLEEDFIPYMIDLLQRYSLDPRHIVLELTESYFVTDIQELREIFHKLRSYHIKIAMDDFGTGYSSLGMLAQSPADIVKIDRVFISKIDDQQREFNRSFIGAVIQLCHSVGITVCVEGVEELAELEAVQSLQADNIQGFYISKPILPEVFEQKYWSEVQEGASA